MPIDKWPTLGYGGPHRNSGGAGFLLVALDGSCDFVGYPDSKPMRLPHTYTVNGRGPKRVGNTSSQAAPHGVFCCKGTDQWISITVTKDTEWEALCLVMGRPETANDSRFGTLVARQKNGAVLRHIIETWTCRFEPNELTEKLQANGVPTGTVTSAADLLENPQMKHREAFWNPEHAEMGTYPIFGQPTKLSHTPERVKMPTPCLGEHTEYVCRDFLGMKGEEFLHNLRDGLFE